MRARACVCVRKDKAGKEMGHRTKWGCDAATKVAGASQSCERHLGWVQMIAHSWVGGTTKNRIMTVLPRGKGASAGRRGVTYTRTGTRNEDTYSPPTREKQ